MTINNLLSARIKNTKEINLKYICRVIRFSERKQLLFKDPGTFLLIVEYHLKVNMIVFGERVQKAS